MVKQMEEVIHAFVEDELMMLSFDLIDLPSISDDDHKNLILLLMLKSIQFVIVIIIFIIK